jgi:hypothetical protein
MGQQQTAGLVLQFMMDFIKLVHNYVTGRGNFIGERTQTTPALAQGVPNMGHFSEIQGDENPPPVNDNDNNDNNDNNWASEDEESENEGGEDDESENGGSEGEGGDGERGQEEGGQDVVIDDEIEMLIREMEERDAEREVRGFLRGI